MTTPNIPAPPGHLSLDTRLDRIESQLDDIRRNMPTTKGLERRVEKLESWQEWAQRLVVGAVIAALLGMVIAPLV